MENKPNFAADQSKVMALKTKREIVADNGIWPTHLSYLERVLDCQKRIKHKVKALGL